MDPKVIAIIVLVVILIAFGVVTFVPFKGKKLFCPASNVFTGNLATTSNCASFCTECDEITETSCKSFIDAKECPDCPETKVDATSCKSFVDAEAKKYNVEAYYTDSWCTKKYTTLSTRSKFCTSTDTAYATYVDSLATLFTTKRLIKATQGTTVRFLYDTLSTASSLSPLALSVAAIETGTFSTRMAGKTAVNAIQNDLVNDISNLVGPIDWRLREYLLSHVLVALGVATNNDYVWYDHNANRSNKWTFGAGKISGDPSKYTVIQGLWTTIGSGNSWTYSYLDLTSTNKTTLLNELKNSTTSGYAIFCR
jgi:hypothetical protein